MSSNRLRVLVALLAAGAACVNARAQADCRAPRPTLLVERIPAGSEGTPVERRLVRTLVGPLALATLASERTVQHLRAVRVPENAKPERLSVVGWLETPAGRVLAVGDRHDPDCDDLPAR